MIELNKIIHDDCMNIMKDIPDKYFELAIVDPPYGAKGKITNGGTWSKKRPKGGFMWDENPGQIFFKELFRISYNQIIFGANYFCNFLPFSRGWILWNKQIEKFTATSDELLWTSFDKKIKIFSRSHTMDRGFMNKNGGNIHPTEKPVCLYQWLLQNYAQPGDKIIDTHSGSGSCAIACHLEKFDFLAIEKDKDYYEASVKRFNEIKQQQTFNFSDVIPETEFHQGILL